MAIKSRINCSPLCELQKKPPVKFEGFSVKQYKEVPPFSFSIPGHFTFTEFTECRAPLDQLPALQASPEHPLNLEQRSSDIEEQKEWRKQRAEQAPTGNSPPSVSCKETAGNAGCNNNQE